MKTLRVLVSLAICFFAFLHFHPAYSGQGSSCLRSSESPDESDEDDSELKVVPGPHNNPFYRSDLRVHMLRYMGADELRAFEGVNSTFREVAYRVDQERWNKRWTDAGVHLISDVPPELSALFKGKGQIFDVGDFILSGTSKQRMAWSRAVKFCGKVGLQMTADLQRPVKCEILDNDQWQTLIKKSKKRSGKYDSRFFPEMEEIFWSKTPRDAAGTHYYSFNGVNLKFGFGFDLPRVLFLLPSNEVYLSVRCGCKIISEQAPIISEKEE